MLNYHNQRLLHEDLKKFAIRIARQSGYIFPPGSMVLFDQLMLHGIDNFIQQCDGIHEKEKIARWIRVKSNTLTLMAEMVELGKHEAPNLLADWEIGVALKKLAPLWPYH